MNWYAARPAPSWLRGFNTALVTVLVFGATVGGTLHLKDVGEQGIQTQHDLQAVLTELHVQDSLEWRGHSGRLTTAELAERMRNSRARAQRMISAIAQTDPALGTDVAKAHQRYADAMDKELRNLQDRVTLPDAGAEPDARAGDQADEHADHADEHADEHAGAHGEAGRAAHGAEEHNDAEVDAAFTFALQTLQEKDAAVAAVSARARELSDVGIVLGVVLALTLIGLLQNRRRRAAVQRQAERKGEARYRALINESSDLVVVTDRSGRMGYMSPSAERLLGAPVGGTVDLVAATHEDDRAVLQNALQSAGGAQLAPLPAVRLHGPQGTRLFEISVQDATSDAAIGGIVVTAHDITERQALQREMERRALHDELTGLPNRRLLAESFREALQNHAGVALLLIDLDRFKEINDTLGHHYGDLLLTEVGPRLGRLLGEHDTIARLGGDEFAVLLPHAGSAEAAVAAARRLSEALSVPFLVEGAELSIEASIGVVLSGLHGDDASTLMQRADVAMYFAKQRNMGVAVYDSTTDSHTPERLALLGDLRRALCNDELSLHYQPKISVVTGQVCGAEALLRWHHPERGFIPPDQFIPLAENTGLIGPLTERVLDMAIAQAAAWADSGTPVQVAVNLSARNLLDEDLDVMVTDRLTEYGLPAALLSLEVTESAIMLEPQRAREILTRLSEAGIAISIDDFGAGYTSLAQLRHLPVTELKVDRSFVGTMETDRSNALIVRSVVELGHTLGLSIVAEGVESAAVLGTLGEYACDVAQGYHIARPMPSAALTEWLAGRPDAASVSGVALHSR